ncbi:MAG: apolipoprotein acyltransferase [Piscirickettsiaceae bacterium]|nr:MAG: apolipoprotein acyltransferase [Piscirickettsiaceae bacterium]PCI70649.1 MAG: apolipoprotein acyltransferase [Piscirickettsiaceae bacterium]
MSTEPFKVAAIQLVSTDIVVDNLNTAAELVMTAVEQGAKVIVLPENFALMAKNSSELINKAETLGEGEIQAFMSQLARRYEIWLVGGSMPIRSSIENKVLSACLVYDAQGQQVGQYNKLHLYDVDMPEHGQRYRESDTFVAGDKVVVIDTPFGKMGLSICYDLRFPELYRQMMQLGAEFMVAPSAFTEVTGREHWSLLCRARAVENTCYIIAPNQGGVHTNGRETYGHSMIVDSWGNVLAEATKGADVVVATIDKTKQDKIRKNFPSVQHGRFDYTVKRH